MTHRGMHRFIPRHADEMLIEIGDPLHVIKTGATFGVKVWLPFTSLHAG